MTDEIKKIDSLEWLLQEEETCRKHVKELRADIPIYTSAFFEARRYGNAEGAARLQAMAEKAKADAAVRTEHYRMHSDNLIASLERDLAYIDSEKLDQFRPETLKALLRAEAYRRETISE